jgi:glycosyltransferase involved in cell wall biosynthesis
MRDDMIALGMPGERIAVHHTGIDHSRFAPAPRAPAKAALGVTGPLVVSVGALIPRKGHDRVIGAVAALPGVSLIVAGEGPSTGLELDHGASRPSSRRPNAEYRPIRSPHAAEL